MGGIFKNLKARELGLTECQKCGECCRESPCQILTEEVDVVAAHLQISREEFLKTYIVEAFPGLIDYFLKNGFSLPLCRGNIDDDGSVQASNLQGSVWKDGDCIFLVQETNLCRIWPVRPEAARDFYCWVR